MDDHIYRHINGGRTVVEYIRRDATPEEYETYQRHATEMRIERFVQRLSPTDFETLVQAVAYRKNR